MPDFIRHQKIPPRYGCTSSFENDVSRETTRTTQTMQTMQKLHLRQEASHQVMPTATRCTKHSPVSLAMAMTSGGGSREARSFHKVRST